MAVDFGEARTGIAVCDSMETLAVPESVIYEKNKIKTAEVVAEKAKELQVGMIVVGLAVNMDGSEGYSAAKCREAAGLIEERVTVPVALWDERVSTKAAGRYMNETNTRGKRRKQAIDAAAAAVILQGFLEFRRNRSL
ncbi:MAG: Holliday junction resolvase RuvX [Oscillospiraceae bacterium]|nr:Holliday junction resolvase RuvX [Oscillospiraceae bacterium]